MKILEVLSGSTPPLIDQLTNELNKIKFLQVRMKLNHNDSFTKNRPVLNIANLHSDPAIKAALTAKMGDPSGYKVFDIISTPKDQKGVLAKAIIHLQYAHVNISIVDEVSNRISSPPAILGKMSVDCTDKTAHEIALELFRFVVDWLQTHHLTNSF